MKKLLLERELLAVIKELEGDLSSPCSPQGMQWFRSVVGEIEQ